MKTLHGEGYLPPRPWDEVTKQGGLYYRDTIPDETKLLERAIDGTLDFRDYQQWVEAGWKTPFCTLESANRLSEKLQEELIELIGAHKEYQDTPNDATGEHLAEEAGDVMWVLTAIASNGGMVVSTMTQSALPPGSEAREKPTLDAIDQVSHGDSPVLPDLESEQPFVRLIMEAMDYGLKGQLHNEAKVTYSLSSTDDNLFGLAYVQHYPHLLAQLGSILSESGLSLRDAAANNIRKLRLRRISNTIDKTDPGRA